MLKRNEIATLAGSTPGKRLVLALEGPDRAGSSRVLITEQDHAEGIGWFDQRSVCLDPRQWSQLRSLLATVDRAVERRDDAERPMTLRFPTVAPPDLEAEEALNQHVG